MSDQTQSDQPSEDALAVPDMRALLCIMLFLIAHTSAGRVTPAARAPTPRHFRGNQPTSIGTHGYRRFDRSDRASLLATRRPVASKRTPKAPETKCGNPQRFEGARMMQGQSRSGMDYRGVPRRGGTYVTHCDMPSDSGVLACSF